MIRLYVIVAMSLATLLWIGGRLSAFERDGGVRPSVNLDVPEPAGPVRLYSARSVAQPSATQVSNGQDISLNRRGDGHFYAEVAINGTPIEMMVDTGASGVALSQSDARRAGIATTIGMQDYVGDGASGAVYGDRVAIERIRLGKVEMHDLSGAVLKGGEISLLGQDVLRQFDKVEIQGDRMILQ